MDFWDLITSICDHERYCEFCGVRIWIGYSDGHVWDECLNCIDNGQQKFNLDLAGYITTWDMPEKTMPDWLEIKDIDDRKRLNHEKYYRRIDKNLLKKKYRMIYEDWESTWK